MNHGLTAPQDLRRRLDAGLSQLGIDLGEGAQAALLDYVSLLARWNLVYNLSAVREPAEMVTRHLLDSLAVLPHLAGASLLDLGSGAGLPGIPLALAAPERTVTLLDSNGKKTRFLRQAVLELPLANVAVVQARAEAFRPRAGFDRVISRAYAELAVFWRHAAPLLAVGGRALAMKGRLPEAELAALASEGVLWEACPLRVPGLAAERHLIALGYIPSGHL